MKVAFLLAAALLAGCSTTLVREKPESVRVADGVQLATTSLVEALLGFKGTRVQAANGAWKDQVFSAQCVLNGDGEKLTAVFLAPQLRLLTITLTKPHTITCERAPQVPRAFEPEYALADLAYVNLDTETLRRAVHVERGGRRNDAPDQGGRHARCGSRAPRERRRGLPKRTLRLFLHAAQRRALRPP